MNSTVKIHPISVLFLFAVASGLCFLVPVNPPAVEVNSSSSTIAHLALTP